MKYSEPSHFFDACAMIGKWHQSQPKYSSVDSLLSHMQDFSIKKAVVFHSIAWLYDFRKGNEVLDKEIGAYSELIPCYTWIPFTTGEMPGRDFWDERLRQNGPFAVRLFPKTHNFPLQSPRKGDLFEYLEAKRIPVFVDIDEIDYRDLWSVCQVHPQLQFILGNSGTSCLYGIYREFRRLYEFLESFEHVSLETSFLIGFRGLEDISQRYGARRLIFGSRMPFLEPGSSIARIQYADISASEKQKIAFENLEDLLAGVEI